MDSYILSRYRYRNIIIIRVKVWHDAVSEIIFLTIQIKIGLHNLGSVRFDTDNFFLKHFLWKFQNRRNSFGNLLHLLPIAVSRFIQILSMMTICKRFNSLCHKGNHRLASLKKIVNSLIFHLYYL